MTFLKCPNSYLTLACFVFVLSAQQTAVLQGQSLSPGMPAEEYIRLNGQLVAVDSPPATSPVTGASGWSSSTIGGASGQTSYNSGSGVYTVQGSGSGIAGASDQEQFSYSTLTGDGFFVARLAGVQNPAASAFTGIAIRESLDPGAEEAFIGAQDGQNAYGLARLQDGTLITNEGQTAATVPEWFMLQRFGETIYVWMSTDGKNWNLLAGQLRVSMGPTVLVGFLVSSGSSSVTTTATFDNVSLMPYPPFFSLGGNMAGDYFVLVNRNSGNVLDEPGAIGTDGLALQQFGLNNSVAQQWGVVGSDYFYVERRNSTLVLSLVGQSGTPPNAPNTPVVQSALQYRDDQLWKMISTDGVYLSLINKYSGLALGIASQSKANAAALQQVTYNSTDTSQQWQLVPTSISSISGIVANSSPISTPSMITSPSQSPSASVLVNMYAGPLGYGAYGLGAYDPSYSDSAYAYLNGQPVCGPFQYSGSCTISGFADGAQLVMKEANKGLTIATTTLHVFADPYSGTTYKLQNKNSSIYLRWNGSQVDQGPDDGAADVHWTFVAAGNGSYNVVTQAGKLGTASAGTQYGSTHLPSPLRPIRVSFGRCCRLTPLISFS